MKKVAIYARVSTQKQKEDKTIDTQLNNLREMASEDKIVDEYIDEGWSGSVLARPELDRLRDDAEDGKFEKLYIYDPDRLSRDNIDLGILKNELESNGIQLEFATTDYQQTPEGELLFGMQGLIAKYERQKIAERVRRGRLRKAKEGNFVGSRAPYGYNYVKKEGDKGGYLEVDKEEAKNVRKIFELYLEIKSIRGLVSKLKELGIKPRKNKDTWAKSTLGRILKREAYIGTAYYNKYKTVESSASKGNSKKYKKQKKNGRKLRDKDKWIPISVPKIIDEETFKRVQALRENNRNHLRTKENNYLLTGLMSCGDCGCNYVGDPGDGYPCYRCSYRNKKNVDECDNKQIRTYMIEDKVWEEIEKALKNPELIYEKVEELKEEKKKKYQNKKDDLEDIEELMKKKKEAKEKIIEQYYKNRLTKEEFENTIDKINEEIESLETQKEDIKEVVDQKSNSEKKKDIKDTCSLIEKRLDNLNEEGKEEIMNLIIEDIEYYQDEASIKAIIPKEPCEASIKQIYYVHH